MQSTGHALAHMSQAMHLSSSNSWIPRYRGANESRCSGYCTVTVFWKQYFSVIFIPIEMDFTLSKMFRKYEATVALMRVLSCERLARIIVGGAAEVQPKVTDRRSELDDDPFVQAER